MRIRPAIQIATLCLLLPLLGLAACSRGEPARRAEFVTPAPANADFGDLRVHYNALPTLALSPQAALEYQVERDPDTALLVIAPRQLTNGQERATASQVQARVTDLQGKRHPVALRTVHTGDYSDHIGTFPISARDTYRIEATVSAAGRTEVVKFQRGF